MRCTRPPWRCIGQQLDARATAHTVECFVDGELVKTHVRKPKGGRSTDWDDCPPEKVAFLQRTPTWCRHQAVKAGPAVAQLVEGLLAGQAPHHLRAAQGVGGLADRYGVQRLDRACRRALDVEGVEGPSWRTVKGILAAGLEQAAQASEPSGDADTPALLHAPRAAVRSRHR